ncbi:hypothetical protein A3K63_03400 [Candidatus Micrarchaeota archaeon RBG_16_49_10]|nr:MAG: hypothetical protein A3K63_03400 [Candidatus Micrarchaeota archaeon RBG_16_49_10]
MSKLFSSILVSILLLSSLAYARTYDLDLGDIRFSDDSICRGDTVKAYLTVRLRDDGCDYSCDERTVRVSWYVDGDYEGRTDVRLSRGDSETATMWIDTDGLSSGTHRVKVVASIGGEEESASDSFSVSRCRDDCDTCDRDCRYDDCQRCDYDCGYSDCGYQGCMYDYQRDYYYDSQPYYYDYYPGQYYDYQRDYYDYNYQGGYYTEPTTTTVTATTVPSPTTTTVTIRQTAYAASQTYDVGNVAFWIVLIVLVVLIFAVLAALSRGSFQRTQRVETF